MPPSNKAGEQKNLPGIFISYRRSDTPDAVGRIYDRLVTEFGKARVFKDVDSIPLGQDFRGHLNDIVGDCAAVLAIIGPKWTDIRNEAGQKRLEDPDDFVRIELEAALARSVPVVPVLVGHAPMPGTSQLPSTLSSLAFRQSIEVRPDPDFHNDATRLVSALRQIIDPNAPIVLPMPNANAKSGRSLGWMIAFAIATLAAVVLAIPALKYLRARPPPETRIAIPIPVAEDLFTFALSPDGRQMVYVAKGDAESRLWLRSLSTMTAQPLEGTDRASAPFWSPDGRSIGFFAASALKRLDLAGGLPQTLAPVKTGNLPPNGAWGTNGDILFNSGPAIVRIASTGGPVTEVTKLPTKVIGQSPLTVLPDGKHFLFLSIPDQEKIRGTYLGALDGSPPVLLTAEFGPAVYLSSGWLIMLRLDTVPPKAIGSLVGQRLDVRSARLTGKPVTIATRVTNASVSASGLIAFQIDQPAGKRQLTWVDRTGAELGTIGNADETFNYPRVAPDGHRVVVSRTSEGNQDLWLLDGERASRLTSHASQDSYPTWSPDGQWIAFNSSRSGTFSLYVKSANGVGEEKLLRTTDLGAYPSGWSPDGKYLIYFVLTKENGSDLRTLQMTDVRKSVEFLSTPFQENWGQFSPDGRWVAYNSSEAGSNEVLVRPFPSSRTAPRVVVSTAGGIYPLWSAKRKEIYYINPSGEMMAVPFTVNGSAFVPGAPVKLFDARVVGGGIPNRTGRQYDVAPDGRFLINREPDANAIPTIALLQNWNPDAGK